MELFFFFPKHLFRFFFPEQILSILVVLISLHQCHQDRTLVQRFQSQVDVGEQFTWTEADAREWTYVWVVKQQGGGGGGGGPPMQNSVRNDASKCAAWYAVALNNCRVKTALRNCSFFNKAKRFHYCTVTASHLLTHPGTCWMKPPLFAVLPSSTAPSTVAKQPT